MAAEILLDLDSLDLSRIAMSREEVGEILPQCGEMRQLDYVIHISDDQRELVGVKHVRDDEFWCPLHIPGRPLMPGVLMIEAGAQLATIQYHLRADGEPGFVGFTRLEDAAFRGQVVPGDDLYLLCKEISFRRRRFVTDTQGFVNGSLAFEARITGMVM